MEHQPPQPPQGGVPGPAGRRLHIAHRRSPSELTPLMSMFSSPGSKFVLSPSSPTPTAVVIEMPSSVSAWSITNPTPVEQLAIQQQIELLQQQQQQIQATHQQYVNMGMIPPSQHLAPGGYPPQQQMPNRSPQPTFQFPNQLQPQQMNAPMAAPTQPLSHRRNQSALPNMGMGPPPAPSSGASGSAFGDFGHNRENLSTRGGRGGGPPGGGHQRRHSLALPEAKKAAELAQQKRTTSGFQFPIPGAAGATPTSAEPADSPSSDDRNGQGQAGTGQGLRGRASHGRSQSMAVGVNGRGGSAIRGGGAFQFPPMQATADAGAGGLTQGQGNDFQRRGSSTGHNRNSSRNFEGNWRNQPPQQSPQDQQGPMGNFQGPPQGGFQPGHRNRGSINQSINSIGNFQYGGQPQLIQLPQGQMALVQPQMYPGQQLNPLQMNQLQALQAAQMNGQVGLQGSQHATQSSPQQQQQRKTLFTPYLPQATLPALLGDGQLVSGVLRVNKKNRSDAYVTTHDGLLDADIFICGSKDRNRALEGDLVAVELLDVDEVWGQKREKEEKKKRKDITDTRGGSHNGNGERSHRDNSTNGDDQSNTGEGGIRRRGSLRQRPTQKKNDDVEVEGQSLLLVEEEEVNDEQKPLYAGHIVAVIERVAGQMFSGTLGLLRPSSQATKEKQEAERQARDGGNGRHQESRQQDKPKIVWFKPTDKRVPLIAIPTEQAPRDFVEKHQDYADRIFVACIKRWPITSLHPFGTLVEQLGRMGELKVETDALLRDNNFASDEFSDAVTRSVGLDDWALEKEDQEAIAARRDFRSERTFTIDPNGTNELDDAIHIKTEEDGKIDIGIHISDVAHFIKANSLVDREAKKRGTAVYLMNSSYAMLPPKIAADVCSLIPGQERLTVSVVFKVHPHTGVVYEDETWIGKGIINSDGKLTYKDVDAVLAGHTDTLLKGAEVKDVQILHVSL
jgi:protein SSD1